MISLYMKGYFSSHLMSYTTHNSCTWLVKPATSILTRMNLKYERGLVGPVIHLMNCRKLCEASTRNEVDIVELAQDVKENQRPGIISEVSEKLSDNTDIRIHFRSSIRAKASKLEPCGRK